ncbi:autophagy-related protein 27 [Chlamydoabsidia padenii]|nr:autophagy-related protein 27 [Chlamydoabsidia padenii]
MTLALVLLLGLSFVTILVSGIQEYCLPGYKPNDNYQLDLSPMNRDFIMETRANTKPSTKITRTHVNICNFVTKPPITYDEDFCKANTYVCLRLYHKKGDVERLDEVEELAGDYEDSKLSPEFKIASENHDLTTDGALFALKLHGGNVDGKKQTVIITLECDNNGSHNNPDGPELISDDGYVTKLHWKVVFACASKATEKSPSAKRPSSNIGLPELGGKFTINLVFIILGVLMVLYFISGAIYHYRMFNARGIDLIPHRDFWLDLPYLAKDIIGYLLEAVMSHRRARKGYTPV